MRDIRNLFELENEKYFNPIRVGNFHGNNYMEYESNDGRQKNYQLKNILIKLSYT